ncbi:hypothetical protein KAJ83_01530 [Marivibrio halodurans]|uniref:Uncharacterized protein n=1 Tax=Marivibrio halodurans TaxID=2039722 RepID=A0A8J7RYZ8_9PROT|nr:hypothetical protein [Marivibrio halodurans]MBP5855673.1 hypothetical protein [Marivibrio halodurans]
MEDKNRSSEIRDILARVLIEQLQAEDPDPRIIATAQRYIKENPPEDIPTTDSPAGALDQFMKEKGLPFPSNKEGNA